MRGRRAVAGGILGLAALGGAATQKKCSSADIEKVCVVCMAQPTTPGCKEAFDSGVCKAPSPSPTPTPPEPTPAPTPTVQPTVEPQPTPQPPAGGVVRWCPKQPAPGAVVWVRLKPYGQGFDTEVNVRGDREFCQKIHGDAAGWNCHLEGWSTRQECEQALVKEYSGGKGECPVGQWTNDSHPGVHPCLQTDPYEKDGVSCDHFGNTTVRDDPNTPPFEGEPKVCGEQRDEEGKPMAGYFWIGHGKGQLRACLPNYEGCSNNWVEFEH